MTDTSASLLTELYGLEGQVAVVTGGSGTLGRVMAAGLARAGARVALLARREGALAAAVAEIERAGGEAVALPADVVQEESLLRAREGVLARWGRIDILVNGAGGQVAGAVVPPDGSFFDISFDALRAVVDLNLMGTLLPTGVFGRTMAEAGRGSIVNISSMAADRPLTRGVGYGAAKAAVDNVTRWLATEFATKYGPGLRVNAIAPGFFLAEQNRALLQNPDGSLTSRGEAVIAHTPAGRFGEPAELVAALLWLCGPGAAFVSGVVVPVDGGFSAFSGV